MPVRIQRYIALLSVVLFNVAQAAATRLSLFRGQARYMVADSDTVLKKQSVSVGINYGSDVLFFGRTGPIKYPFMGTDVIYNTKQLRNSIEVASTVSRIFIEASRGC